ncbi:MAG: glycosyltransferase [Anaerolineales bacterium]|nr:MAG: glycosyltransferase [Anaerolineales bacterium]
MILLIFTNTYPYDTVGEQTFLTGEINILQKYFERIVLVPNEKHEKLLPLPQGVEVRLDFAGNFSLEKRFLAFLPALFSKDVWQEIKDRLPASLSFGYLKKIFFFVSGASLTQKWMSNWLKREGLSSSEVVCYTYWFTEIAMGLGRAKTEHPSLRLISRAHGYDLYEEMYKPWPLRSQSISLLDGLFADSDIGTNYLLEKYPRFKYKYATALLGVPEPGGLSKPSDDGVLRVVSCSMVNPIKRIDLLLEGILHAAKCRPDQRIEWTHFGGGEERQNFINRVAAGFPPNASGSFPGYQTQEHLIKTYLEMPIDVFLNVSSTEGTPVSIMEAISCGIPVIATAVGGNVEIVQEKNGFLLGENPTPDDIADALLAVCDQRDEWLEKRQGSREVWQERYNETTNFEAFAQKLIEIRKR